jgi:hypothetical protein
MWPVERQVAPLAFVCSSRVEALNIYAPVLAAADKDHRSIRWTSHNPPTRTSDTGSVHRMLSFCDSGQPSALCASADKCPIRARIG